jgi:ubiquinol-cytochrome c reductase cytochrome b subunit
MRFMSFHFLVPLVVVGLVLVHLFVLHSSGSSSSFEYSVSVDKVSFHSSVLFRDFSVFSMLFSFVGFVLGLLSGSLGHSDNWLVGNLKVTPELIAPE